MAKQRKLTVIFKAVSDGFNKGLDGMQKRMKQFSASLTSVARQAAKWGLIMGGAAAAGVAVLVKRQFQALDAMAKLSDRIGIQTQKLGGLELAASQTGVSNETLVKSLEKMQQVVGDANMGLSEAKRAFETLGLSSDKFAKLSTFKQLTTLADALNGIEDATLRASLAADLFGRAGGREFRNFLDLGSKGINEFVKEADQLGLTFRRLDLTKIEAANDAVDKMRRVSNAVAGEIAINLTSAIEAFASAMTRAGDGARSMRDIVQDVFAGIKTAILTAVGAIDQLEKRFLQLQISFQGNRIFQIFDKYNPGLAISRAIFGTPTAETSAQAARDRLVQLESTGARQFRVFDIFQRAANNFQKLINRRLTGGEAGSPSVGLQNIPLLSALAGSRDGMSGLASARELGIFGGQGRFGSVGGSAVNVGRRIAAKVDAIARDIAEIRRQRSIGPLGVTIV